MQSSRVVADVVPRGYWVPRTAPPVAEAQFLDEYTGRRGRRRGMACTGLKAGDYTELRADMDCIAVMSACPQDIIPINDNRRSKNTLR